MTTANSENLDELSDYLHRYTTQIIDCLPNIVYMVDKNCVIQHANRNFLKLMGYQDVSEIKDSLYNALVSEGHWSQERAQLLKRSDIAALIDREPKYNIAEAPIVAEDGNIIYYHANRVPLFDENDKITGMVVVLTDISGYKRAQEQAEVFKTQLNKKENKTQSSYPPAVARDNHIPPKVLMVEDNEVAQKAAQALLMQLDCQVDIADSGDLATMMFKPGKYDLVFMDIGLGSTSGYAVSKKLRQLEGDSGYHVPIIALTGFEADVVKADCTDYFMEGAITKPLTGEQAKQIIQHYVYHIDIPVKGLKST